MFYDVFPSVFLARILLKRLKLRKVIANSNKSDEALFMNTGKIKFIDYENNQECIKFSKSIKLQNMEDGHSDYFSVPDVVWIIHDLNDLNLIKKAASGSIVVAVIRCIDNDGSILEIPFDLKKYFLKGEMMFILGGDVEEQVALCSSLIDINRFGAWRPFFRDAMIGSDALYFRILILFSHLCTSLFDYEVLSFNVYTNT